MKIDEITIEEFRDYLEEEYRGFQNEEQIIMHEKMTTVLEALELMAEEKEEELTRR